MAISSSDKVKAIIFLVVSALLMAAIILSLVGTQWMKQKDHYYIEFSESLGGLSTGSSVRFHGIKVGKVVKMNIDLQNQMGLIEVEVVKNTPVKTDSIATIEVESFVTGTRYVQITPGSVGAELLEPNDPDVKIACLKSGFQKFAGNIVNLGAQAPALATNLTAMFSQPNAQAVSEIVQKQVPVLLEHVNAFFASQNAMMISSILVRVDNLIATNSASISSAIAGFNTTMTSVNSMVEENREVTRELLKNLSSASKTADGLLSENRLLISNILVKTGTSLDELKEMIGESRQPLRESLEKISSSATLVEEFVSELKDQPSMLIYGKEPQKEDWIDEE
ncbi:MCE family protein [bacterium]|nr:MCE family protein [bacterium]